MTRSLPSGWRLVELGAITVDGPTNGYSPPSAPNALGTRSLKLSATTQGRLVLNDDTIKRLHEIIPIDSWAWLEAGDLLVQRSNTADLVGTAAIYDGPPKSFIYPDLMMRLRFADDATTRWVWRYMNSPSGRLFFSTMAAGAAGSMPKISGTKLRTMPIPLPPPDERRRIADILDKADAIRRKRKEAVALTEELLRSAFLEMFGDPATNPKGWQVKPLEDVVTLYAGNSLPVGVEFTGQAGGYLLLKVGDMNAPGNETKIGSAREWASAVPTSAIVAPAGAVVIPKRGGAIATNKKRVLGRPAALDPNLMAIAPSASVDLAYLKQWFDSIDLSALSNGSTVPQLNKKDLAPLRFPLPPTDAQRRFAAMAAQVRLMRERGESAATASETLFASLVDRAFSGRLTDMEEQC